MESITMTNWNETDLKALVKTAVKEAILEASATDKKPDADLIGVKEVAELCDYRPSYIYELTFRKSIPFFKVGKRIRFSRREIEKWIKAGRPDILRKAIAAETADYIVGNKGGDVVQSLLDHKSIATTQIYAGVIDERKS